MNEHNYAYLKDQLRFAGFGDKLHQELREKMETLRQFSLMYGKEYGKDAAAAILRFRKSTESDLFFFNNYTLYLMATGVEPRQQTFQLKGMSGITMDEGFNLLCGRAVLQKFTNDKGQDYLAWQQLDFKNKDNNNNYRVKTYKDNYGTAFTDATSALTIFPMEPAKAEKIIGSLEQGNLQPALFKNGAEEVALFIQYDPAAKDVILYDKDMKRLGNDEMKAFIRPERLRQDNLLPKKKERGNKKGLSI